jgi:cell wall-associated NlpC family hydrolase
MRSLPTRLIALLFAVLTFVALQGCGATPDTVDGEGGEGETTYGAEITPGDDGEGQSAGDIGDDGDADGPLVAADDGAVGSVNQGLAANAKMRTTSNVNLRKGAGTSFAVLAVIPSGTIVTLLSPVAQNGFLNIEFNGTSGWSSATYLTEVAATGTGGSSGAVSIDGAPSPDNAIARAKAAVGFSYYWGGGAWLAGGATSSNKGSCSGSCPSCSHSGKYGADCSGLVAKAWQFGSKALEVNSHPYSTASFNGSSSSWSTVSRGSLRKGDALVYNSGGRGHIVMFEKGDGWGSPTVIECRGCSYGCVYNARSFTSNYKGIRRSGF